MSRQQGSEFVVECSGCNQPWLFADKQEAWKFWINHRDHYGHRAEEPAAVPTADPQES
jgi:hypothetical protein